MALLKTAQFLVCVQLVFAQDDFASVTSAAGSVRGRVRTYQSDEGVSSRVGSFLGIPYAKPPVGELRFKRTELPEPWEGTLEADKMPPACPQYSEYPFPWYDSEPGQSEDCLYLNVWAPAVALTDNSKRSVKFYVHGDGWLTFGSNRMGYYDGYGDAFDFNAENPGVVVVTVNYRLGALGFLTSGTDDAPGNVGLYDIVTALEWVRDNIAAFGGDPDDVALVGQGGGAIAANLLLQSPRAAALFSLIILDGSTVYTLKALRAHTDKGDGYDGNIRLAGRLAEAVGCDSSITENPGDTVQCLRGVDASQLVQVLSSFSPVNQQPPDVFLPQFGRDDLVPSDPFADLPNVSQYVYLAFNSDEGSHLLTTNNPDDFGVFGEKDVGIDATRAKDILKKFLENYPESVVDELLEDLDEESTVENREKVYKAMGATYVICPIVYLAEKFADNGNEVYILEKKVYPPYNPWADWMGSVHFNNVHADFVHLPDVPLVVNGQSYNYTREQRDVSYKFKDDLLNRELRETRFTTEFRLYNVLDQDNLNDEPRSNPGGRSCEILRPYIVE